MALNEQFAQAMGTVLPGAVWLILCDQKPLPDEYIVITTVDERPEIYSGDQDEQISGLYRAAWYSRAGTAGKAEKMRRAARAAGFLIESTPPEGYDSSTGHYIVYIEASDTDTAEDYETNT